MPYNAPSPPSSASPTPNPSAPSRAVANLVSSADSLHRRVRSTPTFSDERGPGAFAPLGRLPRRHRPDKKAFFEIAPEDTEVDLDPPIPPLHDSSNTTPQNDSGLPLVITSSASPVNAPPPVATVAFPSSQELVDKLNAAQLEPTSGTLFAFPSLSPSPNTTPSTPSLPRTPSTPILLSNGKPLKPSLKSSLSSPAIGMGQGHLRARSEPSTPSVKNVHFPDTDLESVVLFEKTARPRAVSGHDDTETETEGYESPAASGYSFPKPNDPFSVDMDSTLSTPVPAPDAIPHGNVYVETIVFPRTHPPTLRGSVLVKNIAFEKLVALRFTLDNWQTTSEVTCKYICSLPSLPPPFPPEREAVGAPKASWDRFSFLIRLEDVERKLAEKTVVFVARYTATGAGEWWDNNNGRNYRIQFKHVTPAPASKGPSPLRRGESYRPSPTNGISNSAPSHAAASPLALDFETVTPPVVRKQNPPTFGIDTGRAVAPPQPSLSSYRPRNSSVSSITSNSSSTGSLRLSNYVSPVSPPHTPGGLGGLEGSGSRLSFASLGPIVGGQPISAPPASNESSTNRPPESDSTYAALVEKWCFHQSSPTQQTPTAPGTTSNEVWRTPFDNPAYGSTYNFGPPAPSPIVG